VKPAQPWIKICGMTTADGIAAAVAARVDAVGFVFYAPSPRNLSLERALELQALVPPGIARVAVFLHPDRELVDTVLAALRPDCLQLDLADLDGLSTPESIARLAVVRSGSVPARLPRRLLLESARSGSGERADWREARTLGDRHEVILAGGLDADNVATAMAIARPFGVDVSSGVESTPGIKDPARIARFVGVARAASRAATTHESER
jgi:phosphoribosylanthranilate isomerase